MLIFPLCIFFYEMFAQIFPLFNCQFQIFFFIFFFQQFDILGCCCLYAFSLRLTKFPKFIDMLSPNLGIWKALLFQTGGRHGNPFQYSCLENHTDRRVWQETFHKVTKSWTQLSDLAHSTLFQIIFSFFSHLIQRLQLYTFTFLKLAHRILNILNFSLPWQFFSLYVLKFIDFFGHHQSAISSIQIFISDMTFPVLEFPFVPHLKFLLMI